MSTHGKVHLLYVYLCKKQSFGIIHNYWNIKQRCTFTLALLSKKNTMKCWWLELVAIATERKELQCFTEYLKKRTYLLGVWKKYKDFSPKICVLNSMHVKTDCTLSLKANNKAIKKEERSKHVTGQPAINLSKIQLRITGVFISFKILTPMWPYTGFQCRVKLRQTKLHS